MTERLSLLLRIQSQFLLQREQTDPEVMWTPWDHRSVCWGGDLTLCQCAPPHHPCGGHALCHHSRLPLRLLRCWSALFAGERLNFEAKSSIQHRRLRAQVKCLSRPERSGLGFKRQPEMVWSVANYRSVPCLSSR